MVICLEQGADLHMAQLTPLPLTVSCFSKIQIGFTFLVSAHPGSSGQRAIKRVGVCVVCAITGLVHTSSRMNSRLNSSLMPRSSSATCWYSIIGAEFERGRSISGTSNRPSESSCGDVATFCMAFVDACAADEVCTSFTPELLYVNEQFSGRSGEV